MSINVIDDRKVSLSFSEVTQKEDLITISKVLSEFTTEPELNVSTLSEVALPFAPELDRKDIFMTQKIFNTIHS
ncbi:MAG: hypothetical protein KDD45_07195 [Bdellovibrionales bacterium]|nr:hypothetical protein [Bdellovibrionales bacterium]